MENLSDIAEQSSSSSLDNNVTTARNNDDTTARRRRRAFQRILSGMQKPGHLRFLTLTSGPDSPSDFQRSFRMLRMRLLRRNLFRDYIRVCEYTEKGARHEHILWRGNYIDQAYISYLWNEIHHAKIVWIRRVQGRKRLAGYLAKYMTKEGCGRFSYSWGWVYRGFCRHWAMLHKICNKLGIKFEERLKLWRWMVWFGRSWGDMVLTDLQEQV